MVSLVAKWPTRVLLNIYNQKKAKLEGQEAKSNHPKKPLSLAQFSDLHQLSDLELTD